MVNVNLIVPIFLLLIFLLSGPLLLQFVVKAKTTGRHLTVILEKGRPLSIKLLKIVNDDFVVDGADEWTLKTNLMKPVDYPIGWPKILSTFKVGVWCSLVMRGRGDPLDWEDPSVGALSSKELPVVLDPHWLINLVKGVGEEGKVNKGEKMLTYVAAGASVIALLAIFYLITKLGALQAAVNSLGGLP